MRMISPKYGASNNLIRKDMSINLEKREIPQTIPTPPPPKTKK